MSAAAENFDRRIHTSFVEINTELEALYSSRSDSSQVQGSGDALKAALLCTRPYYKPHRVGKEVYRGANAGDFAEINQIDLLLRLCRGNDPYYGQIMQEKIRFMLPDDIGTAHEQPASLRRSLQN